MNKENFNIDKILEKAVLNHKQQKFRVAEELYKEIIELDPKNSIALNNLGTIYLFSNKFEEAIQYFENAIKFKPNYLDAKKNLEIANQKFIIKNNVNDSWKAQISKSPNKGLFILDEFNHKGFFLNSNLDQIKKGDNQLPLLTWPLLDFLKTIDLKDFELFELGSGNSTIWFSKIFKKVKSYETNNEWFKSLKPILDTNVSYNLTSLEEIYECTFKFKSSDWLLIDFAGERTKFVKKLVQFIDDHLPAQIIFDNSEWYRNGAKILSDRGYTEIPFFGFKSGEESISCSSIFLLKKLFRLKIKSEFYYPKHSKKVKNNWDSIE